MQESRKQKNKYVIIYDDFREQGLTLEQAYIKGRVERFNNVGSPYYESNKTLHEVTGKSESTVRRAIDGLVKEGHLYRKSLPRKRLLSTKPFNSEVQNEPNKNNNGVHREQLLDGHNEQLVDVHREHHESNKNASESSMVFTENNKGVHREHHEPFTENTYKIEDKIEDKIEENPNPKNRSTNLNDLPLDKQVELLEEALENMNYRHDEDLY
ncbi:MAG: hypothetical protein ACLT4K_05235 [Catenibacterium sp.]|uniref:hypothetical protein n=1 Tax=Catenibacterium sp. TaxID=2049022 RepID=UPI003993B1BC